MDTNVNMEKLVSLAKRRGFVFQGSEIYGGLAGTWDYGPYGVELKENIKRLWWDIFVHGRQDMYGVDAAILMNQEVWKASGHTGAGFADPLVECQKCRRRFRADHIGWTDNAGKVVHREGVKCPECSGELGGVQQFNLMFKTFVGPTSHEEYQPEGSEHDRNDNGSYSVTDLNPERHYITYDPDAISYLRPETAQGMFVNFKNVLDSLHPQLPFGMAQIGKAFRNEIAPRDFIFRTREFEQMEIEYFVREENWKESFNEWKELMLDWMYMLGLPAERVHELEVPEDERAHYSKRTVDFEFDFPFGRKELYGLAYRTDFDLKNHMEHTGVDLHYTDPATGEKLVPHVIEPTFGLDRTVLAVLASAYDEDELGGEKRTVLRLPAAIAPVRAAVFPLLKNKPELVEKAREVFNSLKKEMRVEFDDNGNIGKRYRRQDEIGTPYCVTIDFETLEDGTVTVRNRDTGAQERVSIAELASHIQEQF